jgi:hypothetical protein
MNEAKAGEKLEKPQEAPHVQLVESELPTDDSDYDVKLQEILDQLEKAPEEPEKETGTLQSLEYQRTVLELRLRELEKSGVINMRAYWSKWILACIVVIVVFDCYLMLALGYGWASYSNATFIPVFIGESILKIFGLAYIVVNYLFSKDSVV